MMSNIDERYSPLFLSLVRDIEVARNMCSTLIEQHRYLDEAYDLLLQAEGKARRVYDMSIDAIKKKDKEFQPRFWSFDGNAVHEITQEEYNEHINVSDEDDMDDEEAIPDLMDGMTQAKPMYREDYSPKN